MDIHQFGQEGEVIRYGIVVHMKVEDKKKSRGMPGTLRLFCLRAKNYFFLAAFLGAAFLAAFLGAAFFAAAFLGAAFFAAAFLGAAFFAAAFLGAAFFAAFFAVAMFFKI
jgi:hypothetical protein